MPELLRKDAAECVWSVEQSEELYRIASWGDDYFHATPGGHIGVRTRGSDSVSIDVVAVVEEARRRAVDFPLLLRFQDVLREQVRRLNQAFEAAIETFEYGNCYRGVYPIKVNQLHEVVEEILDAGREYGMGLECGSKSELVAALPYLADDETLLICNGVKDRTTLGLMVAAQRLGRSVFPVVEKLSEFAELKSLAWEKGFVPRMGARIRLATKGSGRWADCAGPNSKFGLSVSELIRLVEELELSGFSGQLQLLHCHLGSQVADIAALREAVREAAQVYASLVTRGVGLKYLDVGGGLGVNYDESGSDGAVNYSIQEYARAVVQTVKEVCDAQGVAAPVLITESGRVLTAHHSVLIVPVLAAEGRDELDSGTTLSDSAHEASRRLMGLAETVGQTTDESVLLEAFQEATREHEQTRALFTSGCVSLEERAIADRAYWSVCRKVLDRVGNLCPPPPEVRELEALLTDQVLCDFSVFQSILDHWAIGQAFPIMPIDRLDERPSRRGVLVDVTCDSDGRVTQYVSSHLDKTFLPVHPFEQGVPHYLGFFLMGAYEDIMGDAHNLLGRVSEVHVYADEEEAENFWIEKIIPGTAVQEMLAQVQYFPSDLHRRMSELVREKIQSGVVRPTVGMEILDQYMACFQQSTYCASGPLNQELGS